MNNDLSFVGIGAGFSPELANTSAYFVLENRLVILDCGETVFASLYKKGLLHQYPQIAVLLTHLHADHAGSLAALTSYCKLELGKTVDVVHPETQNVQTLHKLMGVEEAEYRLHASVPSNFGFQCAFIPVKHATNMNCYGLLLYTGTFHVWYSGDAAEVPASVLQEFRTGGIQRIYQDTTLESSNFHASLSYLCATFSPQERERVFAMHLRPHEFDPVQAEGFRLAKVI